MEEIVKALLDQNARLTEHIIELSKTIADLHSPVVQLAPEPFTRYPLNVPETEEDARVAFDNGDISHEQLQEVLREIEFFNDEITVPTSR